MEEELQKRFTDCVYFLASPLTCKKGVNCEYRHSEIARLNPRDCFYWMQGGCLNPTCAFRHPPLEGRSEASSESASNQISALPVNKTGVPCYYFYNGFCNKGDRCLFLHGPDDSLPAGKSSNTASVNPDGPEVVKKLSVGSDTGSTPVDRQTNSVDTGPKRVALTTKEPELDIYQSAPHNVAKQNSSPLISESLHEDAVEGKMNFPLAAAGSIQGRSPEPSDDSSNDEMEGHVDTEEWLESSPGFDVLVDDRSEDLGYEDDSEYMLHGDREGRELNGHYLAYDCEQNTEYDPAFPGDGYDYLIAERHINYAGGSSAHSRERSLERVSPMNQKLFASNLASGGHRSRDLRDILEERREGNKHSRNHFSRRLQLSHRIDQSRERSRSRSRKPLPRRRASTFENCSSGSRIDNDAFLSISNHECRFSRSPVNRSRRNYRERTHRKQELLMSEVSGMSASRKRSYTEDLAFFSGPKTLDQIKEEKKRARGDENFSNTPGSLGRNAQGDFQGPKSLSEILKEKRRPGFVEDGYNQAISS